MSPIFESPTTRGNFTPWTATCRERVSRRRSVRATTARGAHLLDRREAWHVTRRAEPSHPERDWLNPRRPSRCHPRRGLLPLPTPETRPNVERPPTRRACVRPDAGRRCIARTLFPPASLTLRGMFVPCSSPLSLSSSFFFFIRFIFATRVLQVNWQIK